MLYVNNQFLDVYSGTPFAKQYESYKQFIEREYKFPIIIRTRREPIINPTGVMEAPKNVMLPAVSVINDGKTNVEWRYTPSHPRMVNGSLEYPLKRIFLKEVNYFTEKDLDLVIYLMFLASPGVRDGFLYIENKKREADEYARIRGQLSAVTFYLYDESSPLTDWDVRTIALALGISNAGSQEFTTNQVRMMIEEAVKEGELSGSYICNYERFKEHALVGERTKLFASIQRLFDMNRLRYDISLSTFILLDENGNDIEQLYKISSSDYIRRVELFANYVRSNPKVAEILSDILGEEITSKEVKYTKKDIESMGLKELRLYATNLGIKKVQFIKREDLVEAVLKKMGELEENNGE